MKTLAGWFSWGHFGLFMIVHLVVLGGGCSGRPLDRDGGAVDTGGTGGSGGHGGTGTGGTGTGGTGTGGSGMGTGGAGDGGADCGCGIFSPYRLCCAGRCVNPRNDPNNCTACGAQCPADKPLCQEGACKAPPCFADAGSDGGTCCGQAACTQGQACCSIEGPLSGSLACVTPTPGGDVCPQGCAPLCISDRERKRAIAPADVDQVLARVARLPIATWRYQDEPESVRHMGPMAQDFRALFGLGDSERSYHSIDAHGVSLAAIQALTKLIEEDQRRIGALERENRTLQQRLDAVVAGAPATTGDQRTAKAATRARHSAAARLPIP